MKMINLAAVEDVINKQNEEFKPYLNDKDERGAAARFMQAVNMAMTLWRCGEENRGTHPADVIGAVTTGVATLLGGHIKTHVEDGYHEVAIIHASGELASKIHRMIKDADSDNPRVKKVQIDREEIGAA